MDRDRADVLAVPLGRDPHLAGDGQVLAAGGDSGAFLKPLGEEQPPPEEIYNPATGAWRRTGSLAPKGRPSATRIGHTATLLSGPRCASAQNCGRVLVAGGEGSNPSIAELYDPEAQDSLSGAQGAWSPTGPLVTSRLFHTATLLTGTTAQCGSNCGKVLVTGGTDFSNLFRPILSSAELYDPATGMWTATGSMTTAREQHRAVLLANGKVLVAGGRDTPVSGTKKAEVYDPASGTWAPVGESTVARVNPAVTPLPGGKVLMAGGGTTAAELYDPASGTWASAAQAPFSAVAAATLPSGRAFIIAAPQTALYDPGSDSWSSATPAEVPRGPTYAVTSLSDGRVLVAGGDIWSPTLHHPPPPEVFDEAASGTKPVITDVIPARGPTTGRTPSRIRGYGFRAVTAVHLGETTVAPRSTEWDSVAATLPAGPPGEVAVKLTRDDGVASDPGPRARFSYVSPRAGAFRATGSPAFARARHTATLLTGPGCADRCGKVLVAGGTGSDGKPLASAELYDPATATWSATGSLGVARSGHVAAGLANGKVLVAGGNGTGASTSAEVYDPATGAWTATGALNAARPDGATATLLTGGPDVCGASCGKVLVAGFDRRAELYDPQAGTWLLTPPAEVPRKLHAAARLAGGEVLVSGGVHASIDLDTGGGGPYFYFQAAAAVETFDPLTGTWTVAGSLNAGRADHTAPLLEGPGCAARCGQVLAAGGGTAASELFSGAAPGSWAITDELEIRRARHTATRLTTGEVLAAGGLSPFDRLPLSELYEPQSGVWSYTNSLATPRESHTATLLTGPGCASRCGKVLIAGGTGEDGSRLASAELFTSAARVTGLAPAAGPAAGGTTVTITGSGFDGGVSEVRFDQIPATGLTVVSDDTLTVTSPPHPAGTVPVTVTGDGGDSDPGPAARFTYQSPSGGGGPGGGGPGGGGLGGGGSGGGPAGGGGSGGPLGGAGGSGIGGAGAGGAAARGSRAQAARLRGLRRCYARVRRHSGRERRRARRGSLLVRARRRAHMRRHARGLRRRCRARYGRTPGRVRGLRARAISRTKVRLSFIAAGTHGRRPPPAHTYLIKQSTRPLAARAASGARVRSVAGAAVCGWAAWGGV